MGMKNVTGVRKVARGRKPRWVLDFRFTDKQGVRQRFRRDATVQTYASALAEAKRLMSKAAETGTVEDDPVEHVEVSPAPKVTFAAFVDDAFEKLFMPRYRPATQVRYRALLRQGLLGHFGKLALEDVGAMDVRAFAATLQARRVQVKGPINLVRTILRAAFDAGVLARLPELPQLVKPSKKLPDAPSDEEVTAMLTTATGWLKTAITLAVFGGLRQGEIRGLEVRDVDLVGGRLLIRRALSEDTEVTPKSGHDRVVPIAPELHAELTEAVRSKLPRARVVVGEGGTTPVRQRVLGVYKAHLAKHGLKERSFHSLRHYFCSVLLRRGASVEVVRILAGHSDLKVTQRYVHAGASELETAISTLGSGRT